jgi:hypothetical protein
VFDVAEVVGVAESGKKLFGEQRAYYQNFFARLFKRYKKYTDRGVHISVDAHGSREVHRAFLEQAEVLAGAEQGQGGIVYEY